MPLFRSVIFPLVLAAVLLAAGLTAWRLGKPSPVDRLQTHARALGRQTIEREVARLRAQLEGAAPARVAALEAALAEEEQRLAAAESRRNGSRTPALTGREERCESCHANSAVCGLSHPRELAEALRRGEPRATVRERFCTTDARIGTVEALVSRLCAPPADDPRGCEEESELSPALDEAAAEYCGTTERRFFCPEDRPEALLRDAADLVAPPAWARSHPAFGVLLGGKHPVETFGCSGCHDPATLSPEVHGEEPVLPSELRGGQTTKGAAIRSAFDDFMLFARGAMLEPDGAGAGRTPQRHALLARCGGCHTADAAPLRGAEELWQGHQLLAELGCQGCHAGSPAGSVKAGPPLRQLAQKLRPGYLLEWLRSQRELRPRTRMPNFWPSPVSEAVRNRETQVIATWLLLQPDEVQLAEAPPGDASRGALLFDEVGCRGCHEIDGAEGARPLASTAERDFAPNLSDAGDRLRSGWTYLWLKDPQAWWPEARMPNLRLSDRDAADLTAHLMERRSGVERPDELGTTEADAAAAPALLERYGCHGCHDVPGLEKSGPIAAGLASSALQAGQVSPDQWRGWTEAKLRHPRAPDGDPGDYRMPDYELSEAELELLLLALRSLAETKLPDAYAAAVPARARTLADGERLVNRFGCRNCHALGGEGGLVLDRYGDDERAPYAPPPLDGQAARTRRAWLAGYLKRPEALRPWLALRMPTFPLSAAEVETLVAWFEARERTKPDAAEAPPADPELLAAARELVHTLQCRGCHPAAGAAPERSGEELGPDLALAAKRLRPEWIARWLADPQRVRPGTRMPSYFVEQPDGKMTTPAPALLGGDGRRQLEALQQLLVHGIDREE